MIVGGNKDLLSEAAIQLVVIFNCIQELQDAYQIMSEDSITIDEMQETFYSPCVVDFLDNLESDGGLWSHLFNKQLLQS